MKKKYARIANAEEARVYGILVSTKSGQCNEKLALETKKRLEQVGKKVYLFISNNINARALDNFPFIQAWINTACPRLVDDQILFKKTIVNASEI